MYDYIATAYYLFTLMQHMKWSREKLVKYQDRKIHQIVNYAYHHVPYYHDKFKGLGIRPENIKGVQDLSRLPIIARKELQQNTAKLISNEFNIGELKRVSTSGSTGQPLFTYVTEKEDAFRKAKLLRANIACGQKPRDKWVVITGPQHKADMHRLQQCLGIYVPTSVSVFEDTATQMTEIEKLRPNVLDGYSSALELLARETERKGDRILSPRMIIGGAELIEDSSRRFIEKVFDAPFYDEYACVELERLAWQCRERSEYHIDADSVVMQFVNESGEEVGSGETGEIVCTSLFNYAMPFIRYSVGDLGKASENVRCECGNTFPLMKVVEGRKDSIVNLVDGRMISPLVIGWSMEFYRYYDCIDQYRVIQRKIDSLELLIKTKGSCRVNEETMRSELSEHMRKMLNLKESEMTLNVEFVEEIPLDRSGKLRKVISELEKN